MKRLLTGGLAIAALALPATAGAASPPAPFGHACVAQNGVRFCPTASDAQRVPSFDGVPLDVDVTLPPTGTGPYPTIVMLHGFPGTKASFESASPFGKDDHTYHWNNTYYAQQGYAVVNLSFRGFGRSCGDPSSRTSPQCDRGWVHAISDQRWELHDVQYLLGLLADEKVTDPARIGVTGTSQGGGSTMELAFLRNRVRNIDGSFSPWKSPAGKHLKIAAAYPRWGYSDLAYSLIPNGRALDFKTPTQPEALKPIGVAKSSVLNALANGGALVANIAPQGADKTADLKGWQAVVNAGEPNGSKAKAIVKQFDEFKGTAGLLGHPVAPLLIMVGWTDPVFPAIEAVRPYNQIRAARGSGADVSIQVGDVGHFTGGNSLDQYEHFNDDGAAFFASHLKGQAPVKAPANVTAFLQRCPKGSNGGGEIDASSWTHLARGAFGLAASRGKVSSSGGDDESAAGADPLKSPDRCAQITPGSDKGTTVLSRVSPGFTMLGLPTVTATVSTKGDFGQLDAILWEVSPTGDKQRLVDFGVYRLTPNQKGRIVFQLQGNGYEFTKGSTIKLELRGRTPNLYRPSNGTFSVKLSNVVVALPTRDKPSAKRGIAKPPKH
jgi:pimeloyl-ACP methyl ester carboxylesterase